MSPRSSPQPSLSAGRMLRRGDNRRVLPDFVAKLCPRAELLPRLAELRAAGGLHQRRVRHPAPRPRHLPGAGARAGREPGHRPEQRSLRREGLGKAPDRPLNDEGDRACVLAALESVSLVTLFDEATPLELLKIVRPELYVKGGDYDVETLAETALVRSWGGDARALPFVDGYSTTALVARIRG